jgi:hypothetical protein
MFDAANADHLFGVVLDDIYLVVIAYMHVNTTV